MTDVIPTPFPIQSTRRSLTPELVRTLQQLRLLAQFGQSSSETPSRNEAVIRRLFKSHKSWTVTRLDESYTAEPGVAVRDIDEQNSGCDKIVFRNLAGAEDIYRGLPRRDPRLQGLNDAKVSIPVSKIAEAIRQTTSRAELVFALGQLGVNVPVTPASSPELPSTLSPSLSKLAALYKGWDGYAAEPPTQAVLTGANCLLEGLRNVHLLPTRVAPSVVGGVGITFKRNDRKAYLELTNTGAVSLLLSDGVNDPHTEPVSLGDPALPAKIREFLGE